MGSIHGSSTKGTTADRVAALQDKLKGAPAPASDAAQQAPLPTVNEPMLVHPWRNSIVKLRDNGAIDVFVDFNTGIRIEPEVKSINLIAAEQKSHVDFIRAFVMKDVIYNVKGNWQINVDGDANITAKGDIDIESTKGDINFTAANNMTFDAKRYDFG